MDFLLLVIKNIFDFPILCFIAGILFALYYQKVQFPNRLATFLSCYLLFMIGYKGGFAIVNGFPPSFIAVCSMLLIWGLIQPFFVFFMLQKISKLDTQTSAAVAGSMGSVSIMTFIAAIGFLQTLGVDFDGSLISILALMEIPGIISAIILGSYFQKGGVIKSKASLAKHLLLNGAILALLIGLGVGKWSPVQLHVYFHYPITTFKIFLSIFLFLMGWKVGLQKHAFKLFSRSFIFGGVSSAFLSAILGVLIARALRLDPGTSTLIGVIAGSASYIAVPAAMKIAFPNAQESIYLPYSLGIIFPFNIILGIPIYYLIANALA